eukprot:scaffold830_cov377-Prasinococcus_capsulatus_cf.AAC.13
MRRKKIWTSPCESSRTSWEWTDRTRICRAGVGMRESALRAFPACAGGGRQPAWLSRDGRASANGSDPYRIRCGPHLPWSTLPARLSAPPGSGRCRIRIGSV